MYVCMYVTMYVCMNVYTCVRACVRSCICVCTCIFITIQDVTELIIRLLTHLRANPDRKTVEGWLGEHVGSLAAWISFWPFFIAIVEKCLGPRGLQATSRAVQALYDEIADEVTFDVFEICTT